MGPRDSASAYDDALKNNLLCHGKKLDIPWEKSCWKDFMSIMLSTPGIIYNGETQTLSFKNAASFKNLLPPLILLKSEDKKSLIKKLEALKFKTNKDLLA